MKPNKSKIGREIKVCRGEENKNSKSEVPRKFGESAWRAENKMFRLEIESFLLPLRRRKSL